ncbi:MAG: DUF4388 domain-containing protein [Candidatus Aminicenantales bacterium]
MDEVPAQGSLLDTPLPLVLYRLWEQKKTGRLVLHGRKEARRLFLHKGLLALAKEALDEDEFLKFLTRQGRLTPALQRRCKVQARSKDDTILKILPETGRLPAPLVWREMELFFLESLTELFEWPDGGYDFSPASTLDLDLLLSGIFTPDAVLQAIRRMTRLEAAYLWLGRKAESWQAFYPSHLSPAALEPHERYILSLLARERSLEELGELSQLVESQTHKVLYSLACTGAAGPALPRTRSKTPTDFSFIDYDKILAAFRDKTAVIFRYISKEVGPVAASIMNKGLEEVNAWLGPNFPRITLNPDGCPELKPFLRAHSGLFREDDARNLSRILDEILAALVLMVKRTLGNEHEAALIRALER